MASIEILLPVGYGSGVTATSYVVDNLKRVYATYDLKFTRTVQGGSDHLIILNSYIPHTMIELELYEPNSIWYYAFDWDWGLDWYEDNKPMQLITDKPHPESRFIIPNGMIALGEISEPQFYEDAKGVCMMESYKAERFDQYSTYLQDPSFGIFVIGSSMNRKYQHQGIKVDSVAHSQLIDLLHNYRFGLVLWDKPHDANNLPLKVAEYLSAGVLPILDYRYEAEMFPLVNNIEKLKIIIGMSESTRRQLVLDLIAHYEGMIDITKVAHQAYLGETDPLFTMEIEEVLEWGREKHRGHYWRDNLDVKDFMQALGRHVDAYNSGETIDAETGKSHLIHAACNLMFQRRIDYGK